MGLFDRPPTRPRTYVEGTPVDPNDMNEVFDSIIADQGSKTLTVSPFGATMLAGTTPDDTEADAGRLVADDLSCIVGLELVAPCVVSEVRIYVKDDAAAGLVLAFVRAGVGGITNLGTDASAGDGTDQTITLAGPLTIEAGYAYHVRVAPDGLTGNPLTLYRIEIDFDQLPP